MSFILTNKPYSDKWYHYALIIIISYFITWIRTTYNLSYAMHTILDIIGYVIVPFIINLTNNNKNKLFNNNYASIVITLSLQVVFYFCYLGLTYWSSLLTSLIVINPMFVSTSRSFLIFFEVLLNPM